MSAAPDAEAPIVFERIDPKTLRLFQASLGIWAAIWTLLAAGIGFPIWLETRSPLCFAPAAVLLVGIGALAMVFPRWELARWGWALRAEDLLVQSGVVFRKLVSIPAGRVQHVDIDQGPLERALGLVHLRIFTGSAQGADATIPGLTPAIAEALRNRLTRREHDDGL